MTDQPPFLRFAALLRIAHHIPGRIRLKLASEGRTEVMGMIGQAKSFVRSLTDLPGIRSVALNPAAGSCVVEYDPALIPPSAWQDLVSGTRSLAAEALLRSIAGLRPAEASGKTAVLV